jgi:hypothetical protein
MMKFTLLLRLAGMATCITFAWTFVSAQNIKPDQSAPRSSTAAQQGRPNPGISRLPPGVACLGPDAAVNITFELISKKDLQGVVRVIPSVKNIGTAPWVPMYSGGTTSGTGMLSLQDDQGIPLTMTPVYYLQPGQEVKGDAYQTSWVGWSTLNPGSFGVQFSDQSGPDLSGKGLTPNYKADCNQDNDYKLVYDDTISLTLFGPKPDYMNDKIAVVSSKVSAPKVTANVKGTQVTTATPVHDLRIIDAVLSYHHWVEEEQKGWFPCGITNSVQAPFVGLSEKPTALQQSDGTTSRRISIECNQAAAAASSRLAVVQIQYTLLGCTLLPSFSSSGTSICDFPNNSGMIYPIVTTSLSFDYNRLCSSSSPVSVDLSPALEGLVEAPHKRRDLPLNTKRELLAELFQKFLRRPPSPSEMATMENDDLEEMLGRIIGSQEYFQTHARGSNPKWVASVVADLLGRSIDATTQRRISRSLAQGVPRSALVQGILRTPLGQEKLLEIYNSHLAR